jgi:hypothetical protein
VKMYVNIRPMLRRSIYDFTRKDFEESVKDYLKFLEQVSSILSKDAWEVDKYLPHSSDYEKQVKEAIQQEITYCKFYLNLQERKEKEKLDEWVLIKREDVETYWGQDIADGEQWIRSNGRIKATIKFDRTKTMVGIEVRFDNDNQFLKFISYDNRLSLKSHLKNQNSIKQRLEEYKEYAEKVLGEHLFPEYLSEKRSFDVLKSLLCVTCNKTVTKES